MRVLLAILLLLQQGMMPGPGTPHAAGGGGATLALIQHPQSISNCTAGGSTCSVTLTQALGIGHLLVVASANVTSSSTITSINVGGTFVPCTGCAVNGSTLAAQGGWVLSTTATAGPIVITYSAAVSGDVVELREYSCTGGTVSHDADATADNGTDTSPFNGATLTLTGTNDVIVQWADGKTIDPTSVSAPYGNFDSAGGVGVADRLNTSSGTASSWIAAGNTSGKTAAAIAMKCQ